MILCSYPLSSYLSSKEKIDKTVAKVLSSGFYILGNEVFLFEKEFANYIGVKFGIGVGSGTEALRIALLACDIKNGDEIITVSHTASATISAIKSVGAKPIFVDIEPDYFTIDAQKIKRAITEKTKAIIPVHLYGHPADMRTINKIAKEFRLKVIEDCAQAHGAKIKKKMVGSFGDFGCFSFYPTKNLGAFGDGGIIVTNDQRLAKKCRLIREYGWEKRYISNIDGENSRLDELQAAILRIKLRTLDQDNQKRTKIAMFYNQKLKKLDLILPKEKLNFIHVYHLYIIRTKKRNRLIKFLKKRGIQSSVHYPVPCHLQPAFIRKDNRILTETEHIAQEIISLPIYPELMRDDQNKVIKEIINFFKNE